MEKKPTKNAMKIVAGLGAAGVIAVSGAALASSQTGGATASSSQSTSTTQQGRQAAPDPGVRGGHQHTQVSGAELSTVKSAVKAKDAAVSIEHVRKDPDGSYDVLGTKAGAKVMVEVSKDLQTIQVRTGGPGGPGGPGGHGAHGPGGHQRGTEVSGATLTDVKSAIEAEDAGVTVEKAFKESDGTYRAFGTKAGQRVMVELSKDLGTVTVKTGMPGPGGPGGHGPRGGFGQSNGGTQESGRSSQTPSSGTPGSTSGASATSVDGAPAAA